MGSLAEGFAAASVPEQWRAQSEWDGENGTITTGPIAGTQLTDFAEILTQFGYDPERVEIVGKVNQWRKEQKDGSWRTSYFFGIQSKRSSIDLPTLYKTSSKAPRARVELAPSERVTVVVYSDLQVGKTGRRGGTPELVERLASKRQIVTDLLKARKPQRIVFLDGGDGFEGFENTGSQMFTNDLSLAGQLDCYGTELWLMLETLHRFAPVDVGVVSSNHTAWRNGKQNLGNPQDDLGLYVHKQVQKRAETAGMDASWHYPAPYDESVTVDALGTVIGMVHGNQFSPGGAVSWWEKQTFGAQAVTHADVLISGHYHSFGSGVAGKNPKSGRERIWLGAPTLDNGSDWFRQTAGRDSEPGMLVFDVTPDGFDLGSLTVK